MSKLDIFKSLKQNLKTLVTFGASEKVKPRRPIAPLEPPIPVPKPVKPKEEDK